MPGERLVPHARRARARLAPPLAAVRAAGSRSRQLGQTFILLVLLLAVALGGIIYSNARPAVSNAARDKITNAALVQARDALLGRAAADSNLPGSLPCPDLVTNFGNNVPNDGVADLLVGNNCPSYLGRLPWRTLGLADLRDGSGERLWYALAPNFRDDNSAQPLNSQTAGQLSVTGTTSANNVVAIVFAAGSPLPGQRRDGANQNTVSNYLEGDNANGDSVYVTGPDTASFNDRMLYITGTQLFAVVGKRVLTELRGVASGTAMGLTAYYSNPSLHSYPWAADPNPSDPKLAGQQSNLRMSGAFPYNDSNLPIPPDAYTWLSSNGWFNLITYSVAQNFTPNTKAAYPQSCGSAGAGCLTVNGFNRAQAALSLTLASGEVISVAVCSSVGGASCP